MAWFRMLIAGVLLQVPVSRAMMQEVPEGLAVATALACTFQVRGPAPYELVTRLAMSKVCGCWIITSTELMSPTCAPSTGGLLTVTTTPFTPFLKLRCPAIDRASPVGSGLVSESALAPPTAAASAADCI